MSVSQRAEGGVKQIRAIVFGKVQGVFYRATAQEKATALGLNGFVRNLPDGSVEVVAAGENEAVEALLTWCHHGPPHARVERVELRDAVPAENGDGFRILG